MEKVEASRISTRQSRLPCASNLESLITYPKKIHSKSGALLGFGNLKYPKSIVQEELDRVRSDLNTASVNES